MNTYPGSSQLRKCGLPRDAEGRPIKAMSQLTGGSVVAPPSVRVTVSRDRSRSPRRSRGRSRSRSRGRRSRSRDRGSRRRSRSRGRRSKSRSPIISTRSSEMTGAELRDLRNRREKEQKQKSNHQHQEFRNDWGRAERFEEQEGEGAKAEVQSSAPGVQK